MPESGLMESGANTFPPFQSYFRLLPSACFHCGSLVYFLCPSAYKVYQNAFVSWSPFHFQRVKQTIQQPVNIPWPASWKSLLQFCSGPTLVYSARCCLHRVISMTIVLGLSGGSVAPILWGHFQAIKSFICVHLKESCEVPLDWNPLQQVTTVSMGFTLTGDHQSCLHVLIKQHQCICVPKSLHRCSKKRSDPRIRLWETKDKE